MELVRKVFVLLSTIFMLTTIIVIILRSSTYERNFLKENYWIGLISGFVGFIVCFTMGCYKPLASLFPLNYILVLVMILGQSIFICAFASVYDYKNVIIATIITLSVVIGLTFYLVMAGDHITVLHGLVTMGLIGLFITAIFAFLEQDRIFQITVAYLFGFFYGAFFLIDIELITENKRNSFCIDDCVYATMIIYLDTATFFFTTLDYLGYTVY